MIIYLAPLVALLGALGYGLSSNSKIQNMGLVAFACGLLVTLMLMSGSHPLRLL